MFFGKKKPTAAAAAPMRPAVAGGGGAAAAVMAPQPPRPYAPAAATAAPAAGASPPPAQPAPNAALSFGALDKQYKRHPLSEQLAAAAAQDVQRTPLLPLQQRVNVLDFVIASPRCDDGVADKVAAHLATQTFQNRFVRVHRVREDDGGGSEAWATQLQCSVAVLLVVSAAGLKGLAEINGAASEFLLFVEFALRDFENGQRLILPLLCDDEQGKPMSDFSTARFTRNRHAHLQTVAAGSVQDTVSALFKLNGRPLPATVVERTEDCLSKLAQAYQSKCHVGAQAFIDRVNRIRSAGAVTSLHLLSYNPGYTRVDNNFTYFGKVCVTSLLTGEIEHSFAIPGQGGNMAAFSADARFVAVERDKGVALYRVASGKLVWQQPEANVAELQFIDDDVLLVLTQSGTVRCLATEDGKEVAKLTGAARVDPIRTRPVCFLSVARDAKLIALGSNDTLTLWRKSAAGAAGAALIYTFKSPKKIERVALAPNGAHVALATEEAVNVLDLSQVLSGAGANVPNAQFPAVIVGGPDDDRYPGVLTFSPDGDRLFVSEQANLRVFHVPSCSEELSFPKDRPEEEQYVGYHSGGFLPASAGLWVCSSKFSYAWSVRESTVTLAHAFNWSQSLFPPLVAVVTALAPDTPYLVSRANAAVQLQQSGSAGSPAAVHVVIDGTVDNKYNGERELRLLSFPLNLPGSLGPPRTFALPKASLFNGWRSVVSAPCNMLLVMFSNYKTMTMLIQGWDLAGSGGHSQKPLYENALEFFEGTSFNGEATPKLSYDGTIVYFQSSSNLVFADVRTGRATKMVSMPGSDRNEDRWNDMVVSADLTRVLFVGKVLGFTFVAHAAGAKRITLPDSEYGVRNAAFLPGQSLCLAMAYDDKYQVTVCDYLAGTLLQAVSLWPKPERNVHLKLIPGETADVFAICDTKRDLAVYSTSQGMVTPIWPRASTVYVDHRTSFQVHPTGLVAFLDTSDGTTYKVVAGNAVGTVVTTGNPNQYLDVKPSSVSVYVPAYVEMLRPALESTRSAAQQIQQELVSRLLNLVLLVEPSSTTTGSAPTQAAAPNAVPAVDASDDGAVGELWQCKGHRSLFHDVFISYRVWSDKDLSLKLALHLDRQAKEGGRGDTLRVFLDRHCLNDGEDWEQGFLYGLQYAAVAVLLVSTKALQGIMQAHEKQDNVLLEYEYAIKASQDGTKIVLPLFVTNDDFSPFVFPDLSLFPDSQHKSPKTLFSSVRETMRLLRDTFVGSAIASNDRFTECTATVLSHVRRAELDGVSRRLRAKALLDPAHTTTAVFASSGGRVDIVRCADGRLNAASARSVQLGGGGKSQRIAHVVAANGSKNVIYGAMADGIAAWTCVDGQQLWKSNLQDEPEQLALAPDGKLLAVVMGNGPEVLLLKTRSGDTRIRLTAAGTVTSVAFSPDSRHLVAVAGRVVTVWELGGFGPVMSKKLRGVQPEHVSMAHTGAQVLVAGKEDDNCMLLLNMDLQAGKLAKNPLYELDGSSSHVSHATLSPFGTFVASVNDDGDLMVHSTETCELLWKVSRALFAKARLVFSPDEQCLVGLQREPRVYVAFNIADGTVLWRNDKDASALTFARWT